MWNSRPNRNAAPAAETVQASSTVDDRHDLETFRTTGDPAAAERLFLRYEARLYGFVHRMLGHPHDAEDIVQRTFQKAYRALDRFEGDAYFKSWLFRIGRNEAINYIHKRNRRNQRQVSNDQLALVQPGDDEDAYALLDQKERARALHEAILLLPDAEREVVLLRLEANLSFREISEMHDLPIGTVLARMHRAKGRLRNLLQPALE